MEAVLDNIENRGFAKGFAEGFAEGVAKGEKAMALLAMNLLDQNRIEDAKRAFDNNEYRTQLMKEFGIR